MAEKKTVVEESTKPKGTEEKPVEEKPKATNDESAIPTSYQASSVFASWSSLPFASLIGDPLRAAVAAQADANKQVLKYMQDVAFGTKAEGSEEPAKAVKFDFEFMNNGKLAKLSVPLITLVPINFLTIDKVKVQFKAAINASSNSTSVTQTIENEINATKKKVDQEKAAQKKAAGSEGGGSQQAGSGSQQSGNTEDDSILGKIKAGVQKLIPTISKISGGESEKSAAPQGDNTSYSSKKDSKSTRDSKYSVETTIDFEVSAVPSDMPGGLSKMLEVLNGAISVINPAGELFITESEATKGSKIYITYKNGEGIFAPADIKISPEEGVKTTTMGDGILATFEKAEKYTVTAGKQTGSIEIKD